MTVATPIIPILTGPTASGKTALALEFATQNSEMEIINADSMLVYRGMNIGTAKPTEEELHSVPHHLIDIRNPDEPYTAGDFVREAMQAIDEIINRGKQPLIAGGTGFYLKALLFGLWTEIPSDPLLRKQFESQPLENIALELQRRDPISALRIGPNDRYRIIRALELIEATGSTLAELEKKRPASPDPRFKLFVVDRAGAELEQRIKLRTHAMLEAGMIDEVKILFERYPTSRALRAVGYRQTVAYLQGEAPAGRKIAPGLPGLEAEINLATRQLVKQQRTWFKGRPEAKWFIMNDHYDALMKELNAIRQANKF